MYVKQIPVPDTGICLIGVANIGQTLASTMASQSVRYKPAIAITRHAFTQSKVETIQQGKLILFNFVSSFTCCFCHS